MGHQVSGQGEKDTGSPGGMGTKGQVLHQVGQEPHGWQRCSRRRGAKEESGDGVGLLHCLTCWPQRWEVEQQQEAGQKPAGEDTDRQHGRCWSSRASLEQNKQEVRGPQPGPE